MSDKKKLVDLILKCLDRMQVFGVLNKEKVFFFLMHKPRIQVCLLFQRLFSCAWSRIFWHVCVSHIILMLIFIKFDRDFTRYKSVGLPVVKREMAVIHGP